MKKWICVILSGAFALGLSACANRFQTDSFNVNENPPMRISAAGSIIK